MVMRLEDALKSSRTRADAGSDLRGNKTGKTGGMRLGDAMSLEMVPTTFDEGIFVISPEKIESFKSKGPIGWVEKWERQDKTELIPFNPEAAIKAVTLLGAVNRLGSGEDPVDEGAADQRQKDVALMTQALEMWEEERIRGFTIGAQVQGGLAYMPSFMIQFIATGGLITLGKKAITKGAQVAAQKIVKDQAFKFSVKGAIRKTAELTTIGTLRTALMPQNITETFANRQIRSQIELTDKGIEILGAPTEKPITSAVKAFGDVFIENFSETLGGPGRRIAGALMPKGLRKSFERMFKAINPEGKTSDLWTKLGFDGFLEEMGEERLGAFMRALTGVSDFGAGREGVDAFGRPLADLDPNSIIDRVIASIPNGEALLVESLVIAVPTGAKMGIAQTQAMLQRRRKKKLGTVSVNELAKELVDEIAKIGEEGVIEIEVPEDIELERKIEEREKRLVELEAKIKRTKVEEEERRSLPFRIRALERRKPGVPKAKRKTKAKKAAEEAAAFERNRLLRLKEKGIPAQLAQRTQEILADVGQGLDKALGVISTRIGNISLKLKDRLRRFEFDLATQIEKDKRAILPFIEGMNRMTKADQVDMDFALKNGNVKVRDVFLEKYNLQEEFKEVRKALDAIYKRANDSGLKVEYLEEMVPRAIKDLRGMVAFFTENDINTNISYGLRLIESDVLNTFTDNQKAELLNTLIRGKKANTISLAKPGQLEERQIEKLTPDLNQFYFKSDAALLQYFFAVNSAIEANRFFGRGKNEAGRNIEDSIGAFVLDLIQKEEISLEQEKVLTDILKARFNQKGTHGIVTTFKNISYIDILGSPIKALTQLGDLFIAAYKNGFFNTIKAIVNPARLTITREDLGITQIGVEFEEGRLSHVFAKKVFDFVGFTAIDGFGKNIVIRGAFIKRQKQAQEGNAEFIAEMKRVFETEADQVIEDFKNGTMSTNVKFILASVLMDVQPVSLSEMPEIYNSGGNLRVFYMLKSFTIKLLDLFRNDVYNNLGTNPKKAAFNMVNLTMALMLSGAGPDFLKDFILGRPINITDTVVDNILKIVGFNKFLIGNTARRGPRSTIMEMVFPPMRFVDSAFKDTRTVLKKGLQPDQWELVNSIPFGGELYYWWFGRGRSKIQKRRTKGSGVTGAP